GDAVVVDRSDSLQATVAVGVHQMEFSIAVEIRKLGGCGRADLSSCREHAPERCGKSGSLDGTTRRRVLISQNVLPFVFFCWRARFYLRPLDFVSRFRAKALLKCASLGTQMRGFPRATASAGAELLAGPGLGPRMRTPFVRGRRAYPWSN